VVAVGEEADDVGVPEPEQRVELLPEHAVEALAAAVDLDGGKSAGEAREVHGAEPALADHGRGEPARHLLHLRQRQPPRPGLAALLFESIGAGAVHVVLALQVAGGRIGAAAAEDELVPLYPHLSRVHLSLSVPSWVSSCTHQREERGKGCKSGEDLGLLAWAAAAAPSIVFVLRLCTWEEVYIVGLFGIQIW
jgi:hypothetical protein